MNEKGFGLNESDGSSDGSQRDSIYVPKYDEEDNQEVYQYIEPEKEEEQIKEFEIQTVNMEVNEIRKPRKIFDDDDSEEEYKIQEPVEEEEKKEQEGLIVGFQSQQSKLKQISIDQIQNDNFDPLEFEEKDFLLEDVSNAPGTVLYDLVNNLGITDSKTLYGIIKAELENFQNTQNEEELAKKRHMEDFIKIYELNKNVMDSLLQKHLENQERDDEFYNIKFEEVPRQYTKEERKYMVKSAMQESSNNHNMVQVQKGLTPEQLKKIIQTERKEAKQVVSVEAIYETQRGNIIGVLSLSTRLIIFEAIPTFEDKDLKNLDDFYCLIALPNLCFYRMEENKAVEQKKKSFLPFQKLFKPIKNYNLELFLNQVNGFVSLEQVEDLKSPIVSLKFQVNHYMTKNKKNNISQDKGIKKLKELLASISTKSIQGLNPEIVTMVPYYSYYDNIKSQIKEKEESKQIKKQSLEQISDHYVQQNHKTRTKEILSSQQQLDLAIFFPGIVRNRKWIKLYSLDDDGIQIQTFFKKVFQYKYTILIIEDSKGYKFGGFFAENWKVSSTFFGSYENFIFTFKNNLQKPIIYKWSGMNNLHQYLNDDNLGVGGGKLGMYSIIFNNTFTNGQSFKSDCYKNEVLSSEEDFVCVNVEAWALYSF